MDKAEYNKIVTLLRLPGVQATVTFHSGAVPPRIRTMAANMLKVGGIVGDGDAARLARALNQQFKLGCAESRNLGIHLVPRLLTAEQKERIVELLRADHIAAMLGQKQRPGWGQTPQHWWEKQLHNHTEGVMSNSQWFGFYMHNRDLHKQLVEYLGSSRSPEQLARTADVVAKLKSEWVFTMDTTQK